RRRRSVLKTLRRKRHPPRSMMTLGSSEALLGGFAITVILTGVLYQFGMLNAVIRGLTRLVRAIVGAAFAIWKRTLAWMPWPLLLVVVLAVEGAGLLFQPIGALAGGGVLLVTGVSACLAYVYLDIERAAV